MSQIIIRNPQFDFPDRPDLCLYDGNPHASALMHGFSMTMPHLEPYLIRTMRAAAPEIRFDDLRDDVRAFAGQEGNHYRTHAAMNDAIKRAVGDHHAAQLDAIEAQMEADYQSFTRTRSLKFNSAYAEGFEAMTFAFARAAHKTQSIAAMKGWARDVWLWHLAEETEHRTVAFEVFDHLYGGYYQRVWMGLRAQQHFGGYWQRFAQVICEAMTGSTLSMKQARKVFGFAGSRAYLATLLPTYHPRKYPMPEGLAQALGGFK